MLFSRSRRLPPGVRSLITAALLVLGTAGNAAAFEDLRVLYGLHEYAEYTDNLFFTSVGKTAQVSLNTVPDLSILYDDGKTRWLARGYYRRESFPDEPDLSGDYYAISGEFGRELNAHHSFSVVGGYTSSSSILLGETLTEPGQLNVLVPQRGAGTTATAWSPAITSFWSRRFTTNLAYEDSQSFADEGTDLFNRALTLSGAYALSRTTFLRAVLQGATYRNRGQPFVDQGDANTLTARVGFARVFTPRFSMELTAGPQGTKEINLPEQVTLIRNARIKKCDPVLGTCEQVFLTEPGVMVENTSVSLAFTLVMDYELDRSTRLSLSATRSTDSGQGVNGTFEQDEAGIVATRALSPRWNVSVGARYIRGESVARAFSILPTVDPATGEREALDNKSFDIGQRVNLRQAYFQPRLNFRINRRWSAYLGWDHTRFENQGRGQSSFNVNRVTLGLEFRDEARF